MSSGGSLRCFRRKSAPGSRSLHGADLVLELPITGAVNAAGYFAETAVSCLRQMGCIDLLSFGSESGNLEDLCRIAEMLDSAEMEAALKARLETGAS